MRAITLAMTLAAFHLIGCEPTVPHGSQSSGALSVIQLQDVRRSYRAAFVEFCSDARDLPIIEVKEAIERHLQREPAGFAVGEGLVVSCSVSALRAWYQEPETIVSNYTLRVQFADRQGGVLAIISLAMVITQSGGGGVYDFSDLDRAAAEIAKFAATHFR